MLIGLPGLCDNAVICQFKGNAKFNFKNIFHSRKLYTVSIGWKSDKNEEYIRGRYFEGLCKYIIPFLTFYQMNEL